MKVRYSLTVALLALILAGCRETVTAPAHNGPGDPSADGGWAGGGG